MASVDRTSTASQRQPTRSPEPPWDAVTPADAATEGTPANGSAQAPALDQPFTEDALFTLRSAVAAHAARLGAGRLINDMVLLAHELSSNAVRHGGGSGRLRLWRAGQHLYCQVTDAGPGLADPEHAGTNRQSASAPGGRGLWIVRQLADLRIETGPGGTTVTAAISMSEPTPGS